MNDRAVNPPPAEAGSCPQCGTRLPVGALDKVFVRGAVKEGRAHPSRLALARVASDHLPVIVDLEVEPR